MSLVTASPTELRKIGEAMNTLRTDLMRHAVAGSQEAGFQSKDALGMAVMMVLVGAAQRFALTDRQYYGLFKTLCADMAASQADAVVQRSVMEMGPEMSEGGIIMPNAGDIN